MARHGASVAVTSAGIAVMFGGIVRLPQNRSTEPTGPGWWDTVLAAPDTAQVLTAQVLLADLWSLDLSDVINWPSVPPSNNSDGYGLPPDNGAGAVPWEHWFTHCFAMNLFLNPGQQVDADCDNTGDEYDPACDPFTVSINCLDGDTECEGDAGGGAVCLAACTLRHSGPSLTDLVCQKCSDSLSEIAKELPPTNLNLVEVAPPLYNYFGQTTPDFGKADPLGFIPAKRQIVHPSARAHAGMYIQEFETGSGVLYMFGGFGLDPVSHSDVPRPLDDLWTTAVGACYTWGYQAGGGPHWPAPRAQPSLLRLQTVAQRNSRTPAVGETAVRTPHTTLRGFVRWLLRKVCTAFFAQNGLRSLTLARAERFRHFPVDRWSSAGAPRAARRCGTCGCSGRRRPSPLALTGRRASTGASPPIYASCARALSLALTHTQNLPTIAPFANMSTKGWLWYTTAAAFSFVSILCTGLHSKCSHRLHWLQMGARRPPHRGGYRDEAADPGGHPQRELVRAHAIPTAPDWRRRDAALVPCPHAGPTTPAWWQHMRLAAWYCSSADSVFKNSALLITPSAAGCRWRPTWPWPAARWSSRSPASWPAAGRARRKVRKSPSWPRSWANFGLF